MARLDNGRPARGNPRRTTTRDRLAAASLATVMASGLAVGYTARPAVADVRHRAAAEVVTPSRPRHSVGGPVAHSRPAADAELALLVGASIGGKVRLMPKSDRWVIRQIDDALLTTKGAPVTNDRARTRFNEVTDRASDT